MTTDATLAPSEIARYARHIVLPEIGGPGQQKLKAARVLVIGAGGLGAPALQYLAAAGVGTLGIVDDDVVSLSNLQRQVIHATADIGRPKVESAAAAIDALNPHVKVVAHPVRLAPQMPMRSSGNTISSSTGRIISIRVISPPIRPRRQAWRSSPVPLDASTAPSPC